MFKRWIMFMPPFLLFSWIKRFHSLLLQYICGLDMILVAASSNEKLLRWYLLYLNNNWLFEVSRIDYVITFCYVFNLFSKGLYRSWIWIKSSRRIFTNIMICNEWNRQCFRFKILLLYSILPITNVALKSVVIYIIKMWRICAASLSIQVLWTTLSTSSNLTFRLHTHS